jgi:hypothetical protein
VFLGDIIGNGSEIFVSIVNPKTTIRRAAMSWIQGTYLVKMLPTLEAMAPSIVKTVIKPSVQTPPTIAALFPEALDPAIYAM